MRNRTRVWTAALTAGVVAAGAAGCSTGQADPGDAAVTAAALDVTEFDSAVGVCTDLDGFVNGNWKRSNMIPADKTQIGSLTVVVNRTLEAQRAIAESAANDWSGDGVPSSDRDKIGVLYRDAMDVDTLEAVGAMPLAPLLARIDAIATRDDIVRYLRDDAVGGGGVLFATGSDADQQDATRRIADVSPTGLGLPTKDYYTDPQYSEIADAYRDYTATALELAGVADAAGQTAQAFDVERQLAAVSLSPEEQRDPENQYRMVTVADANRTTPSFDWGAYFEAQGADVGDGFSLAQPQYYEKVEELLVGAPIPQWQAFLRSSLVHRYDNRLSKEFRDNNFGYASLLGGTDEPAPRWQYAVAAVDGTMENAMGRLYVEREFDEAARDRADDLVQRVIAAMRVRIENLDWMSPETKNKALDKLAAVLPRIGYPDTWDDLSGLTITPGDFFGSLAAAERFHHADDMAKIGTPTDRSEWITSPQTVNAFYSPSDNSINFPAAFLQAPFFDPDADDAVNYGGIGAVIGHEITHGFDDTGSQFDAAGNHTDWWTDADRAEFDARTDRLVEQYSAYAPIPGRPDLHVNGRLTLGENIADLGGVNAAYDALQAALAAAPETAGTTIDGYRPDERFFLNYAQIWRMNTRDEEAVTRLATDTHSPGRYRINGVVPNIPGFAQAFGCGAGDPMVHTGNDLVVVW
ncbi:M13 family metallopeptidase [Prescottella subtropica]|uniref:M13 family metallopeptidase n=1 Tax=Prescottella subtropica TaxID=2545757 RepID=UPI0013866F70|nr:M13 family metallopeptidase [Prescottella subtropica]